MPRLKGRRTTWAPARAAAAAVPSGEPSSTTTTSKAASNARISSITCAMQSSSLYAGTIAIRSATNGFLHTHADQVEQPPRPVEVGVLVERALAGGAPHLLRAPRVVEQLLVGGGRLLGVRDDQQLAAGLEPALDPLVRVGDDRRAGHGELERPRGRGGVEVRVRPARDVEADPRRGGHAREDVERNVGDPPRPAGV